MSRFEEEMMKEMVKERACKLFRKLRKGGGVDPDDAEVGEGPEPSLVELLSLFNYTLWATKQEDWSKVDASKTATAMGWLGKWAEEAAAEGNMDGSVTPPPSAPRDNMLYYFGKSADATPGKGAKEYLSAAAAAACKGLPVNFRKMLSNFGEADARLVVEEGKGKGKQKVDKRRLVGDQHSTFVGPDGCRYPTVEHGFHAAKMRLVPDRGEAAARAFAVHGDRVEVGWSGADAQRARKKLVLTGAQLREWEEKKSEVMKGLMEARFRQSDALREMLLSIPDDVQLWHGTRGECAHRMVELEAVRSTLRRRVVAE